MTCAFLTVGTTSFDALVDAALASDAAVALQSLGLARLLVQLGRGRVPAALLGGRGATATATATAAATLDAGGMLHATLPCGLRVSAYRFKPSVAADVAAAALVVSHAGAGSVYEAARACKPLVVAVNSALADNHQWELARAMAARGHAVACEPAGLASALAGVTLGPRPPLPPPHAAEFVAALDAVVGWEGDGEERGNGGGVGGGDARGGEGDSARVRRRGSGKAGDAAPVVTGRARRAGSGSGSHSRSRSRASGGGGGGGGGGGAR
jgi:beta-1,4-N-acetylglucosaminyltransferase